MLSAFKRILAACVLLALPLAVYQPCLDGDFLWDDDKYVTQNENLRSLPGLIRCWTNPDAVPGAQWYPLVYTSFWLEYQAWELNPYGYHRDNILLHGLCAVLLWIVLRRLSVPGAFLAACIFALHPVCVESVAWITERKNVLSLSFALASLWAYLSFDGCDEEPDRSWRAYGLALALFVFALLSKTVTVTLPAVIALLLWWKLERLRPTRLLPLIPFFLIGFAAAIATVSIEAGHLGTDRMPFFQELEPLERLIAAGKASWFYIGKLILPVNLSFIYPQLNTDGMSPLSYLPFLAWAALLACWWFKRTQVGRGPLTGVLIYLVVVGPALGFFDIAQMRFSFVADHWVYHASVALIALAAAGIVMALRRLRAVDHRFGRAAVSLPVAALLAFGAMTWRQCHVYQGLEPLWRDVLHKNPEAWIAHLNLGIILTRPESLEEAFPHLEEALRLNPDHFRTRHAMGNVLLGLRRTEEAIPHYQRALELHPTYAAALGNLGLSFQALERVDDAVALYRSATSSTNDTFAAVGHYHLGAIRREQGRLEEAREHFKESLRRVSAFDRPKKALREMNKQAVHVP